MIPRQFCIWELPFDLDGSGYERNMGGGLEAKELGISLWNRVGIVDEASLDRIKLLMSPFREEILQLMLRPTTTLTVDHQYVIILRPFSHSRNIKLRVKM